MLQLAVAPTFIRNVQITGDKVTGDVYIAGMDEIGGGCTSGQLGQQQDLSLDRRRYLPGPTPTPAPPSLALAAAIRAFSARMYSSPAYWRHQGWGEPAAFNHVVSLRLCCPQHRTAAIPATSYYIRSTDSGVTFSAPFQLNANTDPTKAQWQPNLSVSEAGTLFATWYDEAPRTAASCQPAQSRHPLLSDAFPEVAR